MPGRVIGYQHESVRDLALIFEDIDAARARDARRELRLAPADLQRRHHVVEKIGRDAAGIIPVLAETEESIGIVGPLGRWPQPHFPVDVILDRKSTRLN